jgi:fructose-1,6-bisphosphatase II
MGIGGNPEGVLTAAAIRCIGGAIQCKPWPRDEAERLRVLSKGVDLEKVYATEDMVSGDDVFFAATGVTNGDLLQGVRYMSGRAVTHSLAMRAHSGTIRWIQAIHNLDRLDKVRFAD